MTNQVGNGTYRKGGYTYNYSQTMKDLTLCSKGKGKGAENLKSTVNSISPAGSTRADYGLELADEQFSSDRARADAKKVVVFFTDGSPTSSSGFQASVANSAIKSAKSLKNKGSDIYTIGIFDGADPNAVPTARDTSNENKFMHAVSSNYPDAESYTSDMLGTRAENANYYKSATNAAELEKIFEEISGSIIKAGYPTEVHDGYGEHESGYITFTDRLGDFMQVDDFTSIVYNGETFDKPTKKPEGNVDTYKFAGAAANLVITVQHAEEGKPQAGDIVTVKIPASLIPLRHFKITDGVLTVDETGPIQVNYTSSVKKDALNNLFTPESVPGLEDYIKSNVTTTENDSKTVSFYANKWNRGQLGDTIANFEPADSNRYYYFQKNTPIYTDKDCKTPAKDQLPLAAKGSYYYKDEFEVAGEGGKVESSTAVIEFTGEDAASSEGAFVRDTSGNLSFKKGTARLAFIDELHTTKERVGGNPTGTATDVLNPKWNNNATEVDVHLGNNGKISYKLTPATVDTKADFGLTKVLEGRDWTDTDEFKFELSATSENDAPMPARTDATVRNGDTTIDFGKITYNKPGEYTYEVREVAGKLGGITYSDYVAKITVKVTVDTAGKLTAEVTKPEDKVFTNTYSAKTETPLTLEATKTLSGRPMADDEFKFALSYAGHDEALLETTNKGGKVEFGPLTYTTKSLAKLVKEDKASFDVSSGKPTWTIHYIAAEQIGELPAGVSATVSAIDAYVTVVDNGDGTLTATAVYGDAGNKFVNAYTAAPVKASLVGKKNLQVSDGLTPADITGKFTFTVTGEEDAPMPASTSVHNDADGKVDFGEITFKLDDLNNALGEKPEKREHTFTYTVTESGEVAGVTNDAKLSREVSFTVTDNGKGKLSVSRNADGDAAFTFTNAYNVKHIEKSVTDQVIATKVLTGRDLKDGEFSFELVEGGKVVAKGTNAADGKIAMDKITYDKPGKHTYTLREAKGNVAGITYSTAEYTIVTTITDNGDGTLNATHELKGAGEAKFNNSYKPNPNEFSVTDQITATKVLTGRTLKDGEFSFKLVEGDKVVAKGTNTADGKIAMDKITYDKPGKHIYTLREVNGGTTSKGITYSDAKFTIETTITDNGDGTLKAEHVLKGATPATFENTYSVTPTDADLDFGLSKAIDGREWTDGDEFSFTITAPDGTPLPNPATVTVNKRDAKDGIAAIKFGKIRYTAAGTYKYEIRENAGSTVGMTYDEHVATAEVTVTENGEGKLIANVAKKENGRFTNTYRTELNYTAAGGLKLSKTLSGRPMTEGQFTFTVTPADEASANALGLLPGANEFKSPATAEGTVGLIDILAGHEVKFTQADAGKTFKYTVAEKNDDQPGYTYDDAVRTVTIAIADDTAGTLTATTTVSGGPEGTLVTEYKTGAAAVGSAVVPFVNSYSATTNTTGGEAAQVVATKTLTGRPMADGEFYFGIAYAGEKEAIEGTCTTNVNGQVSFGFLHYTTEMLADLVNAKRAIRTDKDARLAWTIGYTAFEFTPQLAAKGITAETPSFSFKVIVVDNGNGTLTAKPVYDGIKPEFKNVYGADAVDAALAGTKKLQAAEGLTPADIAGKFTFTVTADEAGAPMPEYATATNDAAGNVDFGKIHFTLDDLNRALGVTTDATDKAEADEADEAEADEAEAEEADVDADANADESSDESESAAPTAPRSHTFTYTVTESGSAPGVTNDANATRKVSYTVTDDGAGHLSVKREGVDPAAFTFTNTYSVTPVDSYVTDQVKTVKRLTGRDLAAGEFTFDLLENGVVVASGTNDVNGNVTLSPIHYEAPGTHTYTLREACPNALGLYKGVTYDGATYTVVTTVSDNGDGTLTATHKLEGTTESAGFTNKYHAMPTQVSIGAIKVLEGRELKKDEFSFKLVGEDIESTVTNDADGKINFDKFEYDEPGTYVYTISEVKGDETGMTYDKSVFTATVNVVDGGEGNLKASVAYTKGDKSVEGIVFNNTYKKPETPVPTPDPGTPKTVTNIVKTVKGFLPTTGDQQAAALLMAFVVAMSGVGALIWGIRKR
ncbi:Spy0128 family protein [Collinsella sp. TF05-9AC]|uniref:Spy0128 family protein n=1 Tax=Collinsella sp. TF05-9AC TaxID=2292330 RepID=UPI000E4333F1|nr:FctA domain-containing protein [Collinsella sp. TF05-9AC]RGL70075.1 VWA domain-containing protein [Collinsella sp. TF05-9AC]